MLYKNPQLQDQMVAIVKEKKWHLLKHFFKTWENDDELVDKVLLWGHLFLPHYMTSESPAVHREWIEYHMNKNNEYWAAPRGFSKTTTLQLCVMFEHAQGMEAFNVIIEKTATEAEEVVSGVRAEFEDNEKILLVYGNLIGTDPDQDFTSKKKPKDIQGDTFINGCRLRGLGFNKPIRGLKTRQYRPTKIRLDDIEEDGHINNPEQRLKYENNYRKGIMPAVDINGSIKMQGTILHYDSLLQNLIDKHNGKIYRAYDPIDPQNTLLWPERWTYEALEKKRMEMMSDGLGSSAFTQEYLNDPVGDEARVFHYSWLFEKVPKKEDPTEYYLVPKNRITKEQFNKIREQRPLNGYAMFDVADSKKDTADYTARTVVFIDDKQRRFIVAADRQRRNINENIDWILETWKEWYRKNLIRIGVEKKGYEDQYKPLLDEKKVEQGVFPVIEELTPLGRNKEGRIKGALEGLFELNRFIFVGWLDEHGNWRPYGDMMKLLEELHDFPSAKHDDLSDSLAYIADIGVAPQSDEMDMPYESAPNDDPFDDVDTIFGESSLNAELGYNSTIDDTQDDDPYE